MTGESTGATTPPAAAAPAAAPVIDVAKITSDAVAAATEAAGKIAEKKATDIAAQKIMAMGKAMAGESTNTENPNAQFMDTFLKNPLGVVQAVSKMAGDKVRDDIDKTEAIKATQRDVVNPFIRDYPELQSEKKLALVERLAEHHQSLGKTYKEALKVACEETVAEFGLEKISEAERQNAYSYGLPGGGAISTKARERSEAKSQSDFLQGQRDRAASIRRKA